MGSDDSRTPVRLHGGAGGTQALLDDLALAARRIEGAGEQTSAARAHVLRVGQAVGDTEHLSPVTAGAASAEVDALTQGEGGLRACVDRLEALAVRVRRAATLYALADLDVRDVVSRVAVAHAGAIGEAGPLAWGPRALMILTAMPSVLVGGGAAWALGHPPTAPQLELLVAQVSAFGVAALPGRHATPARSVPATAGLIDTLQRIVYRLRGLEPPRLTVAQVVLPAGSGSPLAPPAPRGLGDVVTQIHHLYPTAGGPPGAVAVQRLDHADGRRTWVVAVPGTQDFRVGERNPLAMESNFRLMARRQNATATLVEQAMRKAGVAPGEPVLLAGHSQGGMGVMAVAADPALRRRFAITSVLTVGAPVGQQPLPAQVQALHVEHLHDYVPAADGRRNPDAANRTTAVVDLSRSPSAEVRAAALRPAQAHSAAQYASTVDGVTSIDDPSVAGFNASAERVLGDGTARATTQVFAGVMSAPRKAAP